MAYWLRIEADPPEMAMRSDGYAQGFLWFAAITLGFLIGGGMAWGIVA